MKRQFSSQSINLFKNVYQIYIFEWLKQLLNLKLLEIILLFSGWSIKLLLP